MKLYTSYCAVSRYLPKDILKVSIMRNCPVWFKADLELKGLAPKLDDLIAYKNKEISQMEFIKRYTEKVLSRVNVNNMMGYFRNNYSSYKGVAFICVERPSDFCHRKLLAHHIEKAGYTIEEFKPVNEIILKEKG